MVAITTGDIDSLKLLLEHGATPDPKDSRDPPLHIAVAANRVDMVELLLKHGALVTTTNSWGGTAFGVAAVKGNDAVMTALMETAKARGELTAGLTKRKVRFVDQALCDAAAYGRSSWCDRLVEAGGDVNCREQYGSTPLCEACGNGHVETVRLLIKRGANVELESEYGESPLSSAARASQRGPELVKLLLDSKTRMRDGLVHIAVAHHRAETLTLLLEIGAPFRADERILNDAIWSGQADLVRAVLNAKKKDGTPVIVPTNDDVQSAKQSATGNVKPDSAEILRLIEQAAKRP